MKRTLTAKLAVAGGVAALGATACEVDNGVDDTEDPVLDDTGDDL